MAKNRRLELIESLQEKRKSHVIAYVLSDRPGAEGSIGPDAVDEMYRLVSELKPLGKKPLDLFLFAQRGDLTVPWQMVGMIREIFDLFNVMVPHRAHGAATMVALGADTLIMGERGELSPLEAFAPEGLRSGGQGPQAKGLELEDAKALMSLIEGFGRVREKQRIDAFLRAMDRIDPLLLGGMQRSVEQAKADCLRLLQKRRRAFTKGRNKKIVSRLFTDFLYPHRIVTRSEAVKSLGLKQVRSEGNLEPAFQELLTLYQEEFMSGRPFDPASDLEVSGLEEKLFPDRKLAYLETTKRTRVFLEDLKVQRMRESPVNMRLDPQIILPSLHGVAELKEEDLWSFIEGWLQSHLPVLMDEALVRFGKTLPVSGYQRIPMNRRWVDE